MDKCNRHYLDKGIDITPDEVFNYTLSMFKTELGEEKFKEIVRSFSIPLVTYYSSLLRHCKP